MANKPVKADPSAHKYEDYALSRVPQEQRYHWFSVAVMRFGQLSCLSQFLLGAALGFGMTFWEAFWSFTIGAIILEIVSIFTGWIGMKEGLQTSLLTRWTGFGEIGSGIVGLILAVSLIGWFGVQNAVFAAGMQQLLGVFPLWIWCIITGAFVVAIVYFGVASMKWTAYITVPAFILVSFYSIGKALSDYSLGELVASPPPGPHLTIAAGATMVAGGFIVGGIVSPDMTRFNRSAADVVKQTVIGFTLGEYLIGMIGVLLAHAVKSSDVITIILSTSGLIGTIVLITSTVKINDWNLYNSTLGIVNSVELVFHKKVSRRNTTLAVGVLGTVLSALGILDHFIGFLTLLGVAIPPVASIMVVDYFFLKRQRQMLEETRVQGKLPSVTERWNPIGIVAWVGGFLVGAYVPWGIASINSLFVAGLVYYIGGAIFMRARKRNNQSALFRLTDSSRLQTDL